MIGRLGSGQGSDCALAAISSVGSLSVTVVRFLARSPARRIALGQAVPTASGDNSFVDDRSARVRPLELGRAGGVRVDGFVVRHALSPQLSDLGQPGNHLDK